MRIRLLVAVLVAGTCLVGACKREPEGPAERLGEKIDDAAEELGEKMEEAGEDLQRESRD